jgi:hypothetical protein
MPQVAPLHPWEWPSAPWERVHVDFAGPFMDSMFLVLVPVVQQEVCNFVAQDLIVLFHRPHIILKSLNEAFD